MKKLAVLTMALFFAVATYAQDDTKAKKEGPTPEAKAEKVTNKMKEKLNLTDEQAAKIKAINLDAAQQKQALKETAKEKRKEMKGKVKAIETDRDAKIKEVLNDEQKVKYDEMKEKGKEKMKEKRQHKKEKAGHKKDDK